MDGSIDVSYTTFKFTPSTICTLLPASVNDALRHCTLWALLPLFLRNTTEPRSPVTPYE